MIGTPYAVDSLPARLAAEATPEALRALLGDAADDPVLGPFWDDALLGPLREFLGRPGKAFRAGLVLAAWELAGRDDAPPLELPLMVELLHAGSLIVDDVQDRAETRRGAPALHQQLGVPQAINCGNWLYFVAQKLIERSELPERAQLRLHREVADGVLGCHHGQALDLHARVDSLDRTEVGPVVRATSELKTGSLTALAAVVGAVAAGADDGACAALRGFGRGVGVGLQMLNDLRGLRDGEHQDLTDGRPTWVWVWLAELDDGADYEALRERAAAVRAEVEPAPPLAAELRGRVETRGLARARALLSEAFAALDAFADSAAVARLRAHVEHLRRNYET